MALRLTVLRRLISDQDGVMAVEAALLLPVFIALVFGAIDSSNYLVQSHRVEQGLTLAGAYLSKSPDPVSHAQASRQLAVTGTLDGSGVTRVPGWTVNDVNVTGRIVGGDFRSGDRAYVARYETTHTYEGFGMLKAITGGRLTIKATHEERFAL